MSDGARVNTDWHGWRLAFGFFSGIIAWAVQLIIGCALTSVACVTGGRVPVDLLGALAALVTLAAGVVATRGWRLTTENPRPDIVDVEQDENRYEFVAVAGVFLSILFLLLILATAIIGLFQNPCSPITQRFP